ncbi:MAG: chromosome segregation protein SMC [Deltaproteobacteria bacterium]
MRIHSLEIIGFKSFYERTTIVFHRGINAVVGPNGCGKSNIIDAVRWALGEQNPRRLRAEDMTDIISNGGETLKPLGMAQVSLTVTDMPESGFEEVRIKRRLYRSGESEYYINGAACRLKDISELFMDTGAGARAHTIIAQGRIEHLITAKPEDRRALIEEAGGIVKYKARRRETEAQIEATKENLGRVRDIANEAARRMQYLSRQAEEATRYAEISKRAEGLELSILRRRLVTLESSQSDLSREIEDGMIKSVALESQMRVADESLRDLEAKISPVRAQVEILSSEILAAASNLRLRESQKNSLRAEIAAMDEFIAKLDGEIHLLGEESERLVLERAQRVEALEQTKNLIYAEQIELAERERYVADAQSNFEEDRKSLEATRKAVFENLDSISSLKASALALDRESARIKLRVAGASGEVCELDAEMNKTAARIGEYRSAAEGLNARYALAKRSKSEAEATFKRLKTEREAKRGQAEILGKHLGERSSRLGALRRIESNYEWLPEGMRAFLLERKGQRVLGLLADFLIPQKGFERAVEAALGDRLRWVVVSRDEDAIEYLAALRGRSIGRGAFISIENLLSKGGWDGKFPGNGDEIIPLCQVVGAGGIDSAAVDAALAGIFIVPSLDEALRIRAAGWGGASFVTSGGDVLDAAGAISGGGAAKEGVFDRKSEIRELSHEVSALEKSLMDSAEDIKNNGGAISAVEGDLDASAKSLREIEIKDTALKRDIANLEDNLAKTARRRDILHFELEAAASEIERMDERLADARSGEIKAQGEKRGLEDKYKSLQDRVRALAEARRALEAEIAAAGQKSASLAEKQTSCLQSIRELEKRRAQIQEKISRERAERLRKSEMKTAALANLAAALAEIKSLAASVSERERALGIAKAEAERLCADTANIVPRRHSIAESLAAAEREINALQARRREAEIDAGHIRSSIQKLARPSPPPQNLSAIVADEYSHLSAEAAEAELIRLKAEIGKFGPVNLLAPEEYRELRERSDFLDAQTTDLVGAMSSLRKAMTRIDRESEKRFRDTFNAVNGKFAEVFSVLFSGGEAKLILTNPEDALLTGVDVMARPRGKRFQPLSLLSGGEKALSAIALVLSTCFVRAAPFLLLDEIDAPLDDANTSRFLDLLRVIAADSQIIIISHNKKSMQAVDSLLGITSATPGVSKVVSVELRGV